MIDITVKANTRYTITVPCLGPSRNTSPYELWRALGQIDELDLCRVDAVDTGMVDDAGDYYEVWYLEKG